MQPIDFNATPQLFDLTHLTEDAKLVRALRACVELQRSAAADAMRGAYRPRPDALGEVSPERLQQLLQAGVDVDGIRSEREISNVIVFNDPKYADAVMSPDLAQRRKALNALVVDRVRQLFRGRPRLSVTTSGFFLYPPKGYMGWHTNAPNPGWRLYINYADEPGKSFIRYRDLEGGIHTLWDKQVNVRLFRVETARPLWHAIYSDTYRFSIGYRIRLEPSLLERLLRRLKS